MKKSSLIIIGVFAVTSLFAQTKTNKSVPLIVQSAFAKQYPTVKNVNWDIEATNYEASFDLNGLDNSALFNVNGKILETETEIKQLPKEILAALKAKYPNHKILETGKITNSKSVVTYEVEIKGKDLIFDSKGKLIDEIKKEK